MRPSERERKQAQDVADRPSRQTLMPPMPAAVRSAILIFLLATASTSAMAEGAVVGYKFAPGEWARIPAGSGLEVLWKIACGKA